MGIGIASAIVLYVLAFGFFTYLCVVADPDTSSIAKLCTVTLPKFLLSRLRILIGEKAVKNITDLFDYALVITYLVIVLGSWSIMFAYGYPFITKSKHVSSLHKYVGYGVFVLCMGSWNYARRTSPGYITERTIAKFDNYPYDDFLFTNKKCPTLHIRKLARSKYDRMTNRHVARFDHFCGWLNNPIGEENYRYFIAFLIIHVGMCWYGTYITANLFWGEILDKDLFNAVFFNASTGEEVKADRLVVYHYLMMRHFYVAAVFILMSVMSVLLAIFLGFHLYIAAKGMTTNEYYKWRQIKKWYKKEKMKYDKASKEGKVGSKSTGTESNKAVIEEIGDVDIGCVGPSKSIGNTDSTQENISIYEVGKEEFIDPGPIPENVYNLGIVENFKEVFFPRSMRKEALDKWEEAWRNHKKSSKTSVNDEKMKPKKN